MLSTLVGSRIGGPWQLLVVGLGGLGSVLEGELVELCREKIVLERCGAIVKDVRMGRAPSELIKAKGNVRVCRVEDGVLSHLKGLEGIGIQALWPRGVFDIAGLETREIHIVEAIGV